ncbi:MAG: prepilin-type N-terminal cleavage/methylation domain-containing protein [Mariprofundaceae bacterium]|nr:prepilin-type N-terminal cleavage/methylation domain-containing protein [Mariprofundaceae bacterium]
MKQNKESGFTLIELMIVVAIIGILAAIAIPQFSQYRIKAFNSAAQSDLRNAKLAEESLYADYQQYGQSTATKATAIAVGTLLGAGTELVSTAGATNGFVNNKAGQGVGLSSNVTLRADAAGTGSSAVIYTKHAQGDRIFASDTDGTAIYFQTNIGWVGTDMATSTPALTFATISTADDLAAAWIAL